MSILPIIEVPDPRLKTVSEPVTAFDDDLKVLIKDMFETMYDAPGIGLAAIQVGVPKRILVIDLQEPAPHNHEDGEDCDHDHGVINDPRVFINPEIVDPSEELNTYSEGCLSVPDQYADVDRPAAITARWQDEDGKSHEEELDGLLATCLQHEMDHLEGRVIFDHLEASARTTLEAEYKDLK